MVGPMKMGTRHIATHQIVRTAVASCQTSEIPIYGPPDGLSGRDVATPDPNKRVTFAVLCAKRVTESQFMLGNGAFCEVLPHKKPGERADEAAGKPFAMFPGRWFIATLQPIHR
jgi:hypothetical protein